MATKTEDDKPWYESMWDWFGDTSKDIINSKLQSDQAQNQTIDIFGQQVSKTTLLWIAGGSILAAFILVMVRK